MMFFQVSVSAFAFPIDMLHTLDNPEPLACSLPNADVVELHFVQGLLSASKTESFASKRGPNESAIVAIPSEVLRG